MSQFPQVPLRRVWTKLPWHVIHDEKIEIIVVVAGFVVAGLLAMLAGVF